MEYELIAFLMFSTMMLLLMTGQRVYGAIGFVGVMAALMLWGNGSTDLAFTSMMKMMKWYPLLTLPLFIFMGYMLSETGVAEDLYHMFYIWMGGVNGGLAIGTIGLMVVISAMNGLSVAGMAIGTTIALPQLLKKGYDKVMVTGVIQAGSSLGILVPPSVVLVLYGMIARQPVGKLWLAGAIPGLLMAFFFILYIYLRCKMNPSLAPAMTKAERLEITWEEKMSCLKAGIPPLFIFFCMTGLFLMGITSLVESSAVGAVSASLIAILKRRLTRPILHEITKKTLLISCMFMWIIVAALCFGAVFDGLGAVRFVKEFFTSDLGLGPWEILILMQLTYIVMGMFLDDTAMLVIVAPLFIPLAGALGFDLVWYGVLYTITCQIAYMTPPFGYNLFLMRAMAPPEITLNDIYRSVIPFVSIMIVSLILIMVYPEIALWLPETYYK